MLFFRKLLQLSLMPLSLCVELLLVGLLLLWFSRWQRLGKVLVTLGTVLLLAVSSTTIPDLILEPLESRYPPARPAELQAGPEGAAPWFIVVLAGGCRADPRLPLSSYLTLESQARLVEGIILYRQLPGSRLVLSGGGLMATGAEARAMAEVARALGVNPQDLVLEGGSRHTEDQAHNLKKLLGDRPFWLVTSAAHLPRALALFRKQGLKPIPAPAGNLARKVEKFSLFGLVPGSGGVKNAETAWHEYLGLAWLKLQGKI